MMVEKRLSESEGSKVGGGDDSSNILINPWTPHLGGAKAPSVLAQDHRERSKKYSAKPESKEKRRIRDAKVSKIIRVWVLVC